MDPPVPTVQLAGDWVIIEEDPSSIVVRWRDTADGVRINVARGDAGRTVGVAPIVGGRTAELRQGGHVVPLVTPSFASLSAVTIEVQGPDLLVRMEGPPLASLTDHPDAPDDPALAWVRLRPRGETWRIALRGMLALTLPADELVVNERVRDRTVRSAWGDFVQRGGAPLSRSVLAGGVWVYDTAPSLTIQQPYPQLGLTWTPAAVSP